MKDYGNGYSIEELATKYRLSVRTCYRALDDAKQKARIQLAQVEDARKAEILAAYKNSVPLKEMIAKFNVAEGYCSMVANDAGLTENRRNERIKIRQRPRNENIFREYESGVPVQKLSEKYQLSVPGIYKVIQRVRRQKEAMEFCNGLLSKPNSKGYEFTFDIVKGKAVIGQAHYIPKVLRQGYGIRLNDSKFLLQYMPAADARAYMRGINTKDILRHPFAICENNRRVGEISVIHTKTGFLQGYNSIAMQLYGEEYQSYKIGFGKEGVCCPVFLCGQQIAQINKSAVVKDNLDEYLIYAVNEKALMPSVMFAIYIDGIYYANRGMYVDDATTINCEYSLNEEVLSHYDPNFVKGL